ncbi:hypothetical protein HHI36_022332 [Cryptolaemus montrouzieri]|uniref:Uncharacterized protein n=1 Tax=Cryptolaemus montrouzieri TaxID=559131 RepID=A0ABD2MZW1_9CUCU
MHSFPNFTSVQGLIDNEDHIDDMHTTFPSPVFTESVVSRVNERLQIWQRLTCRSDLITWSANEILVPLRSRSPSQLNKNDGSRSVCRNLSRKDLMPQANKSRSPTPNFFSTHQTKFSTNKRAKHQPNTSPNVTK